VWHASYCVSSFRKNRDAAVTTPKILDPGPGRDEFVIIPMVYDEKLVVGELKFWISVAASKEVYIVYWTSIVRRYILFIAIK